MMELHEIPTDIRWKRRILTTVSWFALAVILPITLPVVIPILALWDVITRSELSRSRTMIFFSFFFVIESVGLVIALGIWFRKLCGMDEHAYQMANRRLQRWWARGLFWGSGRIFSMDIRIDGLEKLEDPKPCVVFSRHASTLDTLLPIAVVREMKLFRYVIKAELLADPALDYVAQRFPNVFVNRGSNNPQEEVDKVLAIGKDMTDDSAVVVYPEGTRFSAKKRARLLEKFEENDEMLAITQSLQNTLPPLREGGLKLLETTPEADVVFIAHRGIDKASAMSDLIKGRMTHAKLEVAIWRIAARNVPRSREAMQEFLVNNWRRIDRFVGEQSAGESVRQPEAVGVE